MGQMPLPPAYVNKVLLELDWGMPIHYISPVAAFVVQ